MTKLFSIDDPMLIAHNGRLAWQFPGGRIFPYVSGGDDPDPEPKTFTQADLDRIVADRLARAKSEPPADYAQLQAAATELAALKVKDNTELDNAKATIATLTTERDTLKAQVETAKTDVTAAKADVALEKIRSAFVSDAAGAKILNPEQAWQLLTKEQRDALTIGDDGQVKGGKEVAAKFAEANPHFVGSPSRLKPDPGQGQTGAGTDFGAAGRAEAAKRFPKPADATK